MKEYSYTIHSTSGNETAFVLKGNHITIIYHDILNSIAHFVMEHYDKPEHDNALVLVNTLPSDIMLQELKLNECPIKIFYNLEQYVMGKVNEGTKSYFENVLFEYMRAHNFDEIWDFLMEDYEFMPNDLIKKFRFVPPRYSHYFDTVRETIKARREAINPRYDLFFSGLHDTDTRLWTLANIQSNKYTTQGIKFITSSGYNNVNNYDLQAMCKFALDYPHYSLTDQTQTTTRVYDMVMCGNCVIGHYNPKFINYFEGIIIPVQGDNQTVFANNVKDVCHSDKPYYNGHEIYKEYTYTDEAYDAFRKKFIQKYFDLTGINASAYAGLPLFSAKN